MISLVKPYLQIEKKIILRFSWHYLCIKSLNPLNKMNDSLLRIHNQQSSCSVWDRLYFIEHMTTLRSGHDIMSNDSDSVVSLKKKVYYCDRFWLVFADLISTTSYERLDFIQRIEQESKILSWEHRCWRIMNDHWRCSLHKNLLVGSNVQRWTHSSIA